MYRFEKDTDYAVFTGDDVKLNFSYLVEKMNGVYYVNIPSLNIHFYTQTSDQIAKSTLESVESYFNYWYTIKHQDFFQHMLNLGFSVRSGNHILRDSALQPQIGKRKKLSNTFRLSK